MVSEPSYDYHAIVIGAGLSGIAAARTLLQSGVRSLIVLESGSAVGGTWQVNTYPGCACDVPTVLYSFSFRPQSEITRSYSSQSQILSYINAVVDEFGIREFIRLNTAVTRAEWSDDSGQWTVTCSDGRTFRSQYLVSAVGALSRPHIPDIKGMETFTGHTFHSAKWDHNWSLTGKRVAVIGTGASAIQFVPHVAEQSAHLTLFQRTPPWIIPRRDRVVPQSYREWFKKFPIIQLILRICIYALNELTLFGFLFGPKAMWLPTWIARRHLHSQVTDPRLREKLQPDYAIGCKRILLSDDYYPALMRPNVNVVTDAIECVTAHGIRTVDGVDHEVDGIIYGTGFHVCDCADIFSVIGSGGIQLAETWTRCGMTAYLGTTIPHFPNLFFMTGPNTGIGHTSLIVMIEAQCAYMADCIRQSIANEWRTVSIKPEVANAYNDDVQRRTQGTVWASGCRSWYLDPKGINRALWPDFTLRFTWRTRRFDAENYLIRK